VPAWRRVPRCPRPRPPARRPKTILILGGTGFIGPHLTQEALRRGWKVTISTAANALRKALRGVETLIGDRKGQLDSLRRAYLGCSRRRHRLHPKIREDVRELLAPNVGYCLFISSISAYASFAQPNDEHSPTGKLSNPDTEEVTDDTYGPMKACASNIRRQRSRDASASSDPVTSWDPWIPPIALPTGRCALPGAARCWRPHAARSHSDYRRARPCCLDDEARRVAHHPVTSMPCQPPVRSRWAISSARANTRLLRPQRASPGCRKDFSRRALEVR